MDEKTYKITLSDGTVINNLSLNGNNFISKTSVTKEMFTDKCIPVTINDGTMDEIHNNMALVQVSEGNGEYWFVLRDISLEELSIIKMQSDIEYVAMMSGIEL